MAGHDGFGSCGGNALRVFEAKIRRRRVAGTLPDGRGSVDWRLGRLAVRSIGGSADWHVAQTGRFAAETDGFAQATPATLRMVVRSFRKPLFINEIPVPGSCAHGRVNLGNPIAISGYGYPAKTQEGRRRCRTAAGDPGSR